MSQFNNAWYAITSGNSSNFNKKYATKKRKNVSASRKNRKHRKNNTRRRR